MPELGAAIADDAVVVDGSPVIDYTHFSLTLSRSRRLARWVAWNVDGGSLQRLDRSSMRFRLDPRVPAEHQVGDELYADNRIDRGHLARRSDLLWGPREEAQAANSDSFFFTNISPQVDDFNQAGKDGVWGRLEDALFEDVEVQGLRVSVMGGPVLAEGDIVYRGVALPREFWKVICYVEAGELRTRAFLLTQDLDRLEGIDLDEFRTYQVTLGDLAERTGLVWAPQVQAGESAVAVQRARGRRPLGSTDDIAW